MKTNVKVSVIVAVHNDEENIRTALDSIKNQSLKDIEVILIDAASTDSSKEILKEYCADKRFSYYEIKKNHFSTARNLGIEKAKGKYIAFGDASVIFTKGMLMDMYNCAEMNEAELCVAPMASSDIFGKHEFTSSELLLKQKITTRFDTALIWNPAVTNKLFLKSKLDEMDLCFSAFGKAREAAFSIPFAFECETIVCSPRSAAIYTIPVKNEGVAKFPIEHYLDAYSFIIEKAKIAFEKEIGRCKTSFEIKETDRLQTYYIDQVIHKEITVLLYSYYRHFWNLTDEEIKKYADIIMSLIDVLSKSGKKALLSKNKDIFFDGKLIDNKEEMARNPRVTVCIAKSDFSPLDKNRFKIQVESLFNQTMPCFELVVDEALREIFPEKRLDSLNVRFIKSESLSEFKQNALRECKTDYIMFQDGYARLNPKILMRHYCTNRNEKGYGFTTSPITRFDGTKTAEYSFSEMAFYFDIKQTRVKMNDRMYALDLFFCNKMFSVKHLNGIHFRFTDDPVYDMNVLYNNSSFKKIKHRGAYLPYSEDEAIQRLKESQNSLEPGIAYLYKKYKKIYYNKITVVKRREKEIMVLKIIKRKVFSLISRILMFIFGHMRIKNRIFFYTIRSNGKLLENIKNVYDGCEGRKIVFAKMLPHSIKTSIAARYYLLTSKVIVTDDYLKYLRVVKLRDGQKVIQIWHASGAFKRFGLDAPSRLTRIEEFKTHSQYTDVCVSSDYVRQFYSHAFGVSPEIVKALGTPRTDDLINEEKRAEKRNRLYEMHPLLKDKKVYIYCPTFREEEGTVVDFDPKIDFEKLNDELADDEVLVINRHPVMKLDYLKDKHYSRVKDYSFENTTDLLCVADVVVTDYSSIIFDASLMGIPTLFYCPDHKTYERDFYLDYEKDLPGVIIKDSSVLLDSIRETYNEPDYEKIKKFSEKQMSACDGNSTKRVVSLIESYLDS